MEFFVSYKKALQHYISFYEKAQLRYLYGKNDIYGLAKDSTHSFGSYNTHNKDICIHLAEITNEYKTEKLIIDKINETIVHELLHSLFADLSALQSVQHNMIFDITYGLFPETMFKSFILMYNLKKW